MDADLTQNNTSTQNYLNQPGPAHSLALNEANLQALGGKSKNNKFMMPSSLDSGA